MKKIVETFELGLMVLGALNLAKMIVEEGYNSKKKERA